MLPSWTTIVAVDTAHLPELAAAWPTWAKWRPEILENPLLFVVDEKAGDEEWWEDQLQFILGPGSVFEDPDNPDVDCRIDSTHLPLDWPQRERMLTALVAAVEHVETEWYLKLDTDTIADGHGGSAGMWWEDSWFEGGEGGNAGPVLIASPWGYTKPASMVESCDAWAETQGRFQAFEEALQGDRTRIGTGQRPTRIISSNVAHHTRIISYAMWGRTDWTRRMWRLCDGRMPCPSQDTFLGYCAVRGGWPIVRAKQSKYGWQHCGSNLKRVRERAAIALKA